MALLLFSLVGFITDFTVRLLIATAEEVGVKTYQELVDAALGRLGYIILVLLQFLYPFICKQKCVLFYVNFLLIRSISLSNILANEKKV